MPPIAIVRHATAGPEVLWHLIDAHSPSHRLPGLNTLTYLRGERDRGDAIVMQPAAGETITRAPSRAVHRLGRFLRTLGMDTQPAATAAALCEQAGTSTHPSITAYPHLHLGTLSCFAATRLGRLFPTPDEQRPPITLVVGHCLFGANTAALGMPAADIRDTATLYELETTTRLTQLSAAVLRALPAAPRTVHILVPRTQYYLYLISALQQGHVSPTHYRQWVRLVDDRNTRVRRRLTAELRARLADAAQATRLHHAEDALATVRNHITEEIRHGRHPRLEDCTRIARTNPVWRLVLDSASVTDWADLAAASYTASYLTLALGPHARPPTCPPLLLAVAEPEEAKIYQAAEAVALTHNLPYRSAGLYPLERTIVTDGHKRLRLYHERVTGGRDATGRYWTAPQIISTAYGNPPPHRALPAPLPGRRTPTEDTRRTHAPAGSSTRGP